MPQIRRCMKCYFFDIVLRKTQDGSGGDPAGIPARRQAQLDRRTNTGLERALLECHHLGRGVIMVRTQIQITAEQSRRLKAAAARRNVSISQLIRQGIELVLAGEMEPSPENRVARAKSVVGRFRSGLHDVSRRHDEYLDSAYSTHRQ